MLEKCPQTLNPRNEAIPAAFAKALTGDLSELEGGSADVLPGDSVATVYPAPDDLEARAETSYLAAVIDMNGGYPKQEEVARNENRNTATVCIEGSFKVTVEGVEHELNPGETIYSGHLDTFSIEGTGKLFVLADGGHTVEYPIDPEPVPVISAEDLHDKMAAGDTFVVNVTTLWCSDCDKQSLPLPGFFEALEAEGIPCFEFPVQEVKEEFLSPEHESLVDELGGPGYPRTVLIVDGVVVHNSTLEVVTKEELHNLVPEFTSLRG